MFSNNDTATSRGAVCQLLSPIPFQDLLQEESTPTEFFSAYESKLTFRHHHLKQNIQSTVTETKHTYTVLCRGPTLSFLYFSLYVEAGNWRHSRLNLSTSQWAKSLASCGRQQRPRRPHIPAGTLLGVTGPRSERNRLHAHIPNKCPRSDCRHRINLYSFPWSSPLWLVFQYKGRELKAVMMFTRTLTHRKINLNLCWIYRWRNWKHGLCQGQFTISNRATCVITNITVTTISAISHCEAAEALRNFRP